MAKKSLRQTPDKQTGMADDFPKTLSKTAGVPKTLLLKRKRHLGSIYFSQNTLLLFELFFIKIPVTDEKTNPWLLPK